ncbi:MULTISPECIES: Sapep family Mn(2+)-dependent dipeptidase [Vagococcus]|uniref:Acetylornithine deacetylase/Succinyl-diaminopimelate desuccinylase and related deacylases n=1 Tax=Vagococcus fluvialis bH819 TaxID=1255619 RepID=A0A1X6WJV9_9ENTE|nr:MULTISPECIES: Sapep family Mn(2+)-dependent dipeptidase [Vagococcus]SLM84510.1 Acetylornithine deacetylase/Succinyl-diaminopimelate desuccinylase and related deacylases [Vagococcus fluvialis bH819]HCM90548.1 peptidase M20 [Vagococcus sp.]
MTIDNIDNKLKEIEPQFIEGLTRVMQINSVKGEKIPNAPFGTGPKKALVETLKLAEELGFKTKIIKNAVGYAQLGNDDTDYIGVVGHLDVVHEGTDWDYPPFNLTLNNDSFYGRGVLDNKGPIIANLYALYILKELNFPLSRTIRIIFGTDEESGSSDIPMYLSEENPPSYGYTPDCKYPAVYGERGILGLELVTTIHDNSLSSLTHFRGNFDRSAVPDTLSFSINDVFFDVKGKRAPSNAPDIGKNVITLFSKKLVQEQLVTGEFLDYANWLYRSFHDKHDGSGLAIDFSDEESGSLALTPFNLEIIDNKIKLEFSIRYPVTIQKEAIITNLERVLPPDTTLSINREMPSTYFDKTHPMIRRMTEVYEEITGLDGTPVTTTGATYARSMPNIIAFGPSFPGQKGIAHNKNEYMAKNDLMTNLKIYTYLLAQLGE